VVLINPQTFHFRAGDSLSVSFSESRRYGNSLFEASKWQRLLTGKVDIKGAAKAIGAVATARLRTELEKRLGGPDVARELRTIVGNQTDVLMIYAAKDPGIYYLTVQA